MISTNGSVISRKNISHGRGISEKNIIAVLVSVVIAALLVLLVVVILCWRKKKKLAAVKAAKFIYLGSFTSTPIHFCYKDIEDVTNKFAVKIGQGGFGSVYQGVFNGSLVAVKKLESTDQGNKEFRAEVRSVGKFHHHNLVRLIGFCADGIHTLLVYDYMVNQSLDKWIFKKKNRGLDWDVRFNISLGIAKGLAYIHKDCDSKVVHCDIKPENVLLDHHFTAKISDFGLAKIMNREQSSVFTTPRGTRGYLAPEWVTNIPISDKSDVFSYGMVLLEIISGRRNYVNDGSSEITDFPLFAFKKMEEGKVSDIVDSKMEIDVEHYSQVRSVISVALWCIQHDMSIRPSMTKVVQMLEGVCDVPNPPKSSIEGGASSSNAYMSAVSSVSAVSLSGSR